MSEVVKRQLLELLDKDVEFRYAVAGYLGLSEILRNIERIWEEIKALREGQGKLLENQNKLWENTNRLWEEIKALREEQVRLREGQNKLWENVNKLWEGMNKLREDMIAGFKRYDEELAKLREDFNKAYTEFNIRLSRVERTLEKITLDIEEEARIVIKYRLKELGYDIEITSLITPEVEVNIYGVSNDLCVIGEATLRASLNLINRINSNLEIIKKLYPDKLRPKVLKVIYTSTAMPDLIAMAEAEGFWVLKATGDIVKLPRIS